MKQNDLDRLKETAGTVIYGASDDLIEGEGELRGELNCYDTDGVLMIFSDGTVLKIEYGNSGVWKITLVKQGPLFIQIVTTDDPDDEVYSDVAVFGHGLTGATYVDGDERGDFE